MYVYTRMTDVSFSHKQILLQPRVIWAWESILWTAGAFSMLRKTALCDLKLYYANVHVIQMDRLALPRTMPVTWFCSAPLHGIRIYKLSCGDQQGRSGTQWRWCLTEMSTTQKPVIHLQVKFIIIIIGESFVLKHVKQQYFRREDWTVDRQKIPIPSNGWVGGGWGVYIGWLTPGLLG